MAINPTDVQVTIWPPAVRGGMSLHANASGITALHIPTQLGITVNSERSQYANKEKALQLLESLLLAIDSEKHFDVGPQDIAPAPYADKVAMIKEVRQLAGCGLKEAYDAVYKMGTVAGALLHLNGSTGYCKDGFDKCVCGGDLPAIREGCYNWVKA